MKFIGAFLTVCGLVAAQSAPASNPVRESTGNPAGMAAGAMPITPASVVGRTTKAIHYNHSGSTKIDFRGTSLLPEARGEATVESRQGATQIDARMKGLWPAIKFGSEYLTYVMWAITPEGRAINVGELVLDRDKTMLKATTELQWFGLIVTAEPYFAVTQPSDIVIMEDFIRPDIAGTIEQVDAKYELLKRGQYTVSVDPNGIRPLRLNSRVPLELYEARNAVEIARWTGAERYAPDIFQKAALDLKNAEGYLTGKAGRKPIDTAAREAVQLAENARIIAVKKNDEERLAKERQVGDTDTARFAAQPEAGGAKRDTETRMDAAHTEADRLKSENATIATAQIEAKRLKRESDAQPAAADVAPVLGTAQNESDRLKRKTDAQRVDAERELDSGVKDEAQGEPAKAELRAELLTQFNAILQTRDTVRGLVVNMSDVLFDTDEYSLRPLAREKLAKVAGIVEGHSGLRLDVEGYTDSAGGDEYNQKLSEQRGTSVRDYLMQQGMPGTSVTTKGFGKAGPVASNETAQGRQQNRRVELVISGEIIGTEIGTPIAAR
jgi:outer membrane protein OmpA-like peptidoglycan-associated protein